MKEAGEEEKRIALEKGHVTSDGIPYITVIGDGGWSKRSYGHGYNAASGVVRYFHVSMKLKLQYYCYKFRVSS